MKIYVVLKETNYQGDTIQAIYSKEKDADEHAATKGYWMIRVEEWEVRE